MSKYLMDDDSDDDSYDANWSPGQDPPAFQENQPSPPPPPPPPAVDQGGSYGGIQPPSNYDIPTGYQMPGQPQQAVSFSVPQGDYDAQGGFGERPAYANSYNREELMADEDERRAKAAARGKIMNPIDNKKHRVRPFRCFDEPTFMTEDELYEDMMKPSVSAAFLKSHFPPNTSKIPAELKLSDEIRKMYDSPEVDGRIGSIKVEVLGCVGLARQKPYSAVYVISGDCAFCTDVLNNFRSPMWPCASTRAAVFPVHHAYAKVFVGLFDVRKRQNKDNDVFCGRVAIDIAQLRPNTEYDVTFPLRASSFVYDRRKRGVIRLRFSLHWFSERAAICSYLKSSRWFSQSEPTKGLGQPTIPCAEPKTFRNIAVTCHGQDFPGKYTRMAFRATMREFNLYHINIRFVMKTFMLDALLYERPHISLYLFLAFQHCIYSQVVRMVPPYWTGYILLLFLDNYIHFNVSDRFTLGYAPLTIVELLTGLIRDGKSTNPNFLPLGVKKRAKRKPTKSSKNLDIPKEEGLSSILGYINWERVKVLLGVAPDEVPDDKTLEIQPRDHREFPFSEREEYPKFSVQEALAPSTKAPVKGEEGNTRLAGRLSIYFVKEEEKQGEGDGEEEDDEEEETESDSEEDTDNEDEDEEEDRNIQTAADTQVDDVDVFDMDFEPEEDEVRNMGGAGLFDMGSSKLRRARVRVGPPQNCDISSKKKTPPQQTLQKIEKQMHKMSKGIALERVITVPGARKYGPEPGEEDKGKKKKGTKEDVLAKKSHYDEFDKVLGLQSKTANPVLRITSSFLGPLMRMVRIFLYATRVAFNMATWRDPYFSFWILCYLLTQMFVLLIWPWRPFLFISSFLCLGPQNIFVRKYLEKKAAEKALEKAEQARKEAEGISFTPVVNDSKIEQAEYVIPADKKDDRVISSAAGSRDRRSMAKYSKSVKKSRKGEESFEDTEEKIEQRPAFSTGHNSRINKKIRPREVAVPYSKLRKDRFYDWPPDPTVSRATPVVGPWLKGAAVDEADVLPEPEVLPIPAVNGTSNGLNPDIENLRRRYIAEQQ